MSRFRISAFFVLLTACGDDGSPAREGPVGPPAGMTELQWGEDLFEHRGCVACHRIDQGESVGPPLDGLVGKTRSLADGREVLADVDYLRQSLLEPEAALVSGYRPVMPSYEGILHPAEVDAVVVYLQSLTRRTP